jgi:hypothetical protein
MFQIVQMLQVISEKHGDSILQSFPDLCSYVLLTNMLPIKIWHTTVIVHM